MAEFTFNIVLPADAHKGSNRDDLLRPRLPRIVRYNVSMDQPLILSRTKEHIRKLLAGDSSGHDWWHIDRVRRVALTIAREEHANLFLVELAAVAISSVWAFLFTYGMLWLIDRITPVKVQESDEREGLDQSLHGETAYLEGA